MVDRAALAVAVLRRLEAWYERLDTGFAELLAATRRRSVLLGKQIILRAGTNDVHGTAEALDDCGRLILRKADGSSEVFGAGEATVVKPELQSS